MVKDPGFRLYLITDRNLFASESLLFTAVEEALQGGVKAVQLREKDLGIRDLLDMAYRMRRLTAQYTARLFINDRVDVALAVSADGVHLGQSGIPADAARKAAGKKLKIGVSAHSLAEAEKAEKEGADFITLGPVYETPSKKQYGAPLGTGMLKTVAGQISLPVFAIGGITPDRISEVLHAGAYGIALISGIFAADNIKTRTGEFVRLLQ